MRAAITGAVLATVVLLAGAARAEDEVDAAIGAFRERMEHALDDTARVVAVHELGFRRDPRVVPVLKPLLQHPNLDIRIAAAQQIGEQKDPAVAPYLIALYEKEESAKDRSVSFLVALLEGIGEADAKGRFKFIERVYRRWFAENLDLVRAAARAMALARTADAVGHLVDLLEYAQARAEAPVQTEEKRAVHEALATQCRRLLRGVTALDLKGARAWRDWWRENRRTWKPPAPGGSPAADPSADPMSWTDPSREFSVRWPSKGWTVHESRTASSRRPEAWREGPSHVSGWRRTESRGPGSRTPGPWRRRGAGRWTGRYSTRSPNAAGGP